MRVLKRLSTENKLSLLQIVHFFSTEKPNRKEALRILRPSGCAPLAHA